MYILNLFFRQYEKIKKQVNIGYKKSFVSKDWHQLNRFAVLFFYLKKIEIIYLVLTKAYWFALMLFVNLKK